MAKDSQPVAVQIRWESLSEKRSGRSFETLLGSSEDCWKESDKDNWLDEGVFYTFVHPAIAEFERYSCRISGACKSSWFTHELSDDG